MRWWIKILFGLLLAVKLTPSVAHDNAAKTNDEPSQQEQSKNHLKKPATTGEGCLIDERITRQLEVKFRWPLQLLVLTNTGVKALINEPAIKIYQPVTAVPLHHFYRTLLFPFHSNT
ncbi:hypothetical protein INP83_10375 [Mucilaginibacter sp. 21P]|uniref:hypothetical protein n=1 Tax=Mucilaginibacter sp. 21P TaxID=2778902 RepID=UPI001C5679D8|nr:hypothetical protein [Mucilaginibacter sp. 21P]QXV67464.1 hypothetical protein INP83_10375 [Mucilaginibacter sp. 21P]